jgi:hypothetical protein
MLFSRGHDLALHPQKADLMTWRHYQPVGAALSRSRVERCLLPNPASASMWRDAELKPCYSRHSHFDAQTQVSLQVEWLNSPTIQDVTCNQVLCMRTASSHDNATNQQV